jgi:acyl dehydratase
MESKENDSSVMSLDQLPTGYEFPFVSYELNRDLVGKYLAAVDEQEDFLTVGIVPPLAIAASAMTAVSKSIKVPPGSIHASQDFEFLKPVPVGATISCGGKVAQKLERGRLKLIGIEIQALDQDQKAVLTGKATIAVPG